jgi:hypothetical protein
MPQAPRILHIDRGFMLKRSQADRAIESCACAWVIPGVSVRQLTLAEAIQARNVQAKQREPLATAEIPGIAYDRPTDWSLVQAANDFVAAAV